MVAAPVDRCLLAIDAVDRNTLVQFVDELGGSPGVIGLGKLIFQTSRKIARMRVRFVLLFIVAVGAEHVGERRLAISGLKKGLGGTRTVGMLTGIFLEDF